MNESREKALSVMGSLSTSVFDLRSRLTGKEYFNQRPITVPELKALFAGCRALFDAAEVVLFGNDVPVAIPANPDNMKEKVNATCKTPAA